MMTRKLCLCFYILFGFCSLSHAQNAEIRLLSEFYLGQEISFVKDTGRIAELIRRADEWKFSRVDSAIILAKYAFSLSRNLGYNKGMAITLRKLGGYYFEKQEYTESKQYALKAEGYSILAAGEDNTLLPRVYMNLGTLYTVLGQGDSAGDYFNRAIDLIESQQIQDKSLVAYVYANFATFLVSYGHYQQALIYEYKSLHLGRALQDTPILALNMFNLGLTYDELGNSSKDKTRYVDSAILYYQQARTYYGYLGNEMGIVQSLSGIGWAYLNRDENGTAQRYFDVAFRQCPEECRNQAGVNWGRGYLKVKAGDYNRALPYLLHALELYEQYNIITKKTQLYQDISQCYYLLGNLDSAYHYVILLNDLKSQLYTEDQATRINEMEVKYRIAEKQKELVAKELQLTKKNGELRSRNWMMVAIACAGIALTGFFFSLYRNNKHKQRLLAEQQHNQMLLAQMEGVEQERSRIAQELHDGVGGLLAAVKMNFSILEQDHNELRQSRHYQDTLALLNSTSGELRKTAHHLMPGLLAQQPLDEALRKYCAKVSAGQDQLKLHFQAYGTEQALPESLKRTAFLIAQELILNILKHAAASQALVQLTIKAELLHLMVEDNGKGLPDNNPDKDGLGLSTLQQRVAALGGQCTIQSAPGCGTTIDLVFVLPQPA